MLKLGDAGEEWVVSLLCRRFGLLELFTRQPNHLKNLLCGISRIYHVSAPLPRRVPRRNRPLQVMRNVDVGAGAGGVSPGDDAYAKPEEEEEFVVPKDFPYKSLGNTDEIQELDPLTSKVLDDELQNIMIQIWRDLPERPPTEAERVVADRIRNDAGDELRNILGLNVTKRLLNTFNPLMVKVEFNDKPVGDTFRCFLKWLGCVAMKRVGLHVYVAQLRKVTDFDRVTLRHNVRIRELKAKITPYYNYTECPPNLRTVYKEPEGSTPLNRSTGSESETDKTAPNENQTKNVDSPTDTKKSAGTNEEVKKTTKTAQAVKQSVTEHEFKKPEVPKIKAHKVETKTVANVAKTAQATTDAKPAANPPKPAASPPKPAASPPKPAASPPKVAVSTTPTPTAKTVVAKKVIPKTEAPKEVPEQKPTKKESPKKTQIQKAKTPVKKPIPKTPAKATTPKKKPRIESDFDELDDEDILALMSNAIVLDECKGSDDEA